MCTLHHVGRSGDIYLDFAGVMVGGVGGENYRADVEILGGYCGMCRNIGRGNEFLAGKPGSGQPVSDYNVVRFFRCFSTPFYAKTV